MGGTVYRHWRASIGGNWVNAKSHAPYLMSILIRYALLANMYLVEGSEGHTLRTNACAVGSCVRVGDGLQSHFVGLIVSQCEVIPKYLPVENPARGQRKRRVAA